MITLVVNGKTVITNQEIPGITGGALDSNEGEPGPIYIQETMARLNTGKSRSHQ